jgi:dipeptidyl aminopeptidase/acylaminoacyl peptidase
VDEDGPNWSELHVQDLAGGPLRPFVTGKVNVSAVQWTPDGTALTFLQKRGDDKHTALYRIALDGGEARRAAALESSIGAYALAPDGTRAALVAPEPEDAARKAAKDKGFAAEVYEEDGPRARVWIAELGSSAVPRLLELAGSAHEVAWSPDGGRLALSIAPTPLVDDEYMRKRIQIVDCTSGALLGHVENAGKLGAFAWSPDGAHLGLIAAADVHDPQAARLAVVPAGGGAPRFLAPGVEEDFAQLAWQDADTLMYVGSRGVWSTFGKVELDGSGRKELHGAAQPCLTAFTLSKDGQSAAFVGSSPDRPPEAFGMRHGQAAPTRLTDSNPWLAGVRLGAQELIELEARDGLALEALLVRPLGEEPGVRWPLVLYVHGGPEAHHANGWLTSYGDPAQSLAAQGIGVLHVNYRGSTGRGEAFAKLSQGDPGGREFEDLLDAVDELVERGLVDPARVGVTGGSYGGYATAWLSTRYSERFAAGVMFVGISDKLSKVGTTDIPDEEFYVHALHRVWDDWQFFLERSPIFHAGGCTTPLLIAHGKDDPRVNPGQSRELYRHLKLRSEAPVRLVLYPGEGHGNRKAAAKLDYDLRLEQWFRHYLLGPGGTPPPFALDYADPGLESAAAVAEAGAPRD